MNFDTLSLNGTGISQLGGELDVDLINGFQPALGQQSPIVAAFGGLSGTFSSVRAPDLAPGLRMNVIYAPNRVTLAIVADICDLNGDGSADAADAGILFGNWGNAGIGDCNGDGIVDAADAGRLFGDWTGDAVNPAMSVPEPSILVATGIFTILAIALFNTFTEDYAVIQSQKTDSRKVND